MYSRYLWLSRLPMGARRLVVGFLVVAVAGPALAVDETPLDWVAMSVGLLGGLALFLFGMGG